MKKKCQTHFMACLFSKNLVDLLIRLSLISYLKPTAVLLLSTKEKLLLNKIINAQYLLLLAQTANMLLQFTKNIHFTKLIKVNERLREFNFRKFSDGVESFFHIDVSDDRGNRLMFKLRKTAGQWNIIEQALPQWIWNNEAVLNNILAEEGF